MGIVSDWYIRLIPSDKRWQPSPEAAASAVAYVAGLFTCPLDHVEDVTHEFYDDVTLIDAGENTTQVTCTYCGNDICEWFFDLTEEHRDSIGDPVVTVPCCGKAAPLDSLRYDWPVGFARFEVCAMNPTGQATTSTPASSPT